MDYKAFYEVEQKRADKAEDELAALRKQIEMLNEIASYYRQDRHEMIDRGIELELENEKLRQDISGLLSGVSRAPRECYACGSVDVVSNWFIPKAVRGAGFGIQTTFVRVWYCARHEPKKDE